MTSTTSGRAAAARLPSSVMPLTTLRACSSTPVGEKRMCDVAYAQTQAAISALRDESRVVEDAHLTHDCRIARHEPVHLQQRMYASARHGLYRAFAESGALG